MAQPARDAVVAELLRRYGRTYAAEADIRLARNTPAPLFQLLCLSLLASARISAAVAMRATRALMADGMTTPEKLSRATWAHRTKVLNRSGYARYDESTSRYLAASAELLLDEYGGDLRRLREAAAGDVAEARRRLTAFTGIGEAGADLFLREVQLVWDEVRPFADDRAAAGAAELGLPTDAAALRRLVDDDPTFVRLVAALVRCSLDDGADDVLAAAADR